MGNVSKGRKREPSRQKGREDPRRNRFNSFLFHCVLILAIGLLAYSNSFHNPFQWDENVCLVQNPVVKNLKYLFDLSSGRPADPERCPLSRTRTVGYLTFAINYKLHGFNVLGYHLFNLMIHLGNALLVYLFILLTFKTPFLEGATLKRDSNFVALFSALIFVSHPLQTEAVTYVFQRFASLTAFFYLSSLVFYIRWRLDREDQKTSRFKPTAYFILSLVSTVFAMNTKEIALTLPFVILIYEFFFFAGRVRPRMLRLLPWFLSLAILPLMGMGAGNQASFRYLAELPRQVYLFTQFRVVLTYIRLLFFPAHQNIDYDYPVYPSFFVPEVYLSFLFHLAVIGLALYLYYRSKVTLRDLRLSSFAILWFFVTLSVESSIIPISNIICEYRVYLPSVGWAMAVTVSAWVIAEKLTPRFPGLKKIMIALFAAIVILSSVLTYARNAVWKDEMTLWEDVVTKSPNKARGHFSLGVVLGKMGRLDEAIKEFQTSLNLEPNQIKIHLNLGIIYASQGKVDDALKEYETALTIDPKDPAAHYNLAVLFAQIQRLDDAVTEFQTALESNPYDASAHNNLGVVFARQGRLNEAMREFKAALEIEPDHINARNNLKKIDNP
jgi:Flp pilus assembly protein TadD